MNIGAHKVGSALEELSMFCACLGRTQTGSNKTLYEKNIPYSTWCDRISVGLNRTGAQCIECDKKLHKTPKDIFFPSGKARIKYVFCQNTVKPLALRMRPFFLPIVFCRVSQLYLLLPLGCSQMLTWSFSRSCKIWQRQALVHRSQQCPVFDYWIYTMYVPYFSYNPKIY